MLRRLIIILLIVVGFAQDELTDRRVIALSVIANPRNNLSIKDSDTYKWVTESDELQNYNLSARDDSDFNTFSFSIFYIKANGIGGYINYGKQRNFGNNYFISNKTEEEAKNDFINDYLVSPTQYDEDRGFTPPHINSYHFETGITYQKINNVVGYLGLNLTSVDFFNGLMDGGSINTQKYVGMSFGILLIPYQTKQYSGITCQLGYSHSFGFGGGFDLGIGYRL